MAVGHFEGQANGGVGGHGLGVNAVVNHLDFALERLRKGAGLPVGGRYACIGHFKVQKVVEIFQAQATHLTFIGSWKLGIKSNIGTLGVIKKFAINTQLGLRPHFFQEQTLAPTMVGHDHIGVVALLFHLQCCLEASFCTDGFGFKIRHPGMHVGCAAPLGGVVHQAHTLPRLHVAFLHGHGTDLMTLTNQGRCQKLKLPRKILMDKKYVHVVCHSAHPQYQPSSFTMVRTAVN